MAIFFSNVVAIGKHYSDFIFIIKKAKQICSQYIIYINIVIHIFS